MVKDRKLIIAGNWKMNKTAAEALDLVNGIKREVASVKEVDIVVCPPFTALAGVSEALLNSNIRLGAQNMSENGPGAFTGEIAASMLKEFSVRYVILGHSERRQLFGETDDGVARKVAAARAAGLVPIVCVGETLAEREAGTTLAVVERQLRGGLPGLDADAIAAVVVAYEPVWAIGTGKVATPEQAQEVHAFLRRTLADMAGAAAADRCRILYGGSVKPDNIDELMKQPDIDGALVGGASLNVESFLRIVRFV